MCIYIQAITPESLFNKVFFGRSPGLLSCWRLPIFQVIMKDSGKDDRQTFLELTVAGTAPGFHGVPF